MQKLISVHFFSKELGQLLLSTPEPGMLYFVFNPKVIAVVVAHNLEAGEFVAQVSASQLKQSLSSCYVQDLLYSMLCFLCTSLFIPVLPFLDQGGPEAIDLLIESNETILQIPFYPPQQRLEDFTSEVTLASLLSLLSSFLFLRAS